MKNAKELREITMETVNRVLAERQNRAMEVLENKIAPQLQKMAEAGNFYTSFHVDADVDIEVIVSELTENDYGVRRKGRVLEISWA
jgi:hypothetical protein